MPRRAFEKALRLSSDLGYFLLALPNCLWWLRLQNTANKAAWRSGLSRESVLAGATGIFNPMTVKENENYSGQQLLPSPAMAQHYENCNFNNTVLDDLTISSTFRRCTFIGASLQRAKLAKAVFINCNLQAAKFSEATMRCCRFICCSFQRVDFAGTKGLTTCYFAKDCEHFNTEGAVVTFNFHADAYKLRPMAPVHVAKSPPKENKVSTIQELAPASHYRSPPSSAAEEPTKSWDYDPNSVDSWEEDMWGAAWMEYANTGYGGYYNNYSSEPKKNYGYGTNAVLECPDIAEFRECK